MGCVRCLPVALSEECNFFAFFERGGPDKIILGPHWKETSTEKFSLTEKCHGPLILTINRSKESSSAIKIELHCHCGYKITTENYYWFDGYSEVKFTFSRWFIETQSSHWIPFGATEKIPYKKSPNGNLYCLYTHIANVSLVLIPNKALESYAWQGVSVIFNQHAYLDSDCRRKKKKALGFCH